MNNTETRIKKYLNQLNKKSADYATSAFKKYGGSEKSTMVDGVTKMVDELIADKEECVECAKMKYGLRGYIIGTVVTTGVCSIMWFLSKKDARKQHQLEKEEFVEILEKEVARAELDELLITDDECAPADREECKR